MDEQMDDRPHVGPHARRDLTDRDYVRINLGKAYWDAKVASVQDADVRKVLIRYCERIVIMANSGSGLVISGAIGSGKTWAASAVLKEAVRRRFPSYFVAHEELRELQFQDRVFGDGTDGITVNQKLKEAKFLVVDNLNEPFIVDKVFGPVHLERLVARRNSRKLVTILTTRVAKSIRKESSLFDVVSETMVPVNIEGANLRDLARKRLRERVLGE